MTQQNEFHIARPCFSSQRTADEEVFSITTPAHVPNFGAFDPTAFHIYQKEKQTNKQQTFHGTSIYFKTQVICKHILFWEGYYTPSRKMKRNPHIPKSRLQNQGSKTQAEDWSHVICKRKHISWTVPQIVSSALLSLCSVAPEVPYVFRATKHTFLFPAQHVCLLWREREGEREDLLPLWGTARSPPLTRLQKSLLLLVARETDRKAAAGLTVPRGV